MVNQSRDDVREYPRLQREVRVELQTLSYPLPTGPGEVTTSKDISAAGICCVSDTAFEPGTLLTAEIHLPGWQRHKTSLSVRLDPKAMTRPLSVVAEVVWTRALEDSHGFEIGIKFQNVAEDDLHAIRRVLDR